MEKIDVKEKTVILSSQPTEDISDEKANKDPEIVFICNGTIHKMMYNLT